MNPITLIIVFVLGLIGGVLIRDFMGDKPKTEPAPEPTPKPEVVRDDAWYDDFVSRQLCNGKVGSWKIQHLCIECGTPSDHTDGDCCRKCGCTHPTKSIPIRHLYDAVLYFTSPECRAALQRKYPDATITNDWESLLVNDRWEQRTEPCTHEVEPTEE